MIRGLLVALSLVCTVQAFAGVTADRFIWERSGRFFLSVSVDGMAMELRGNVRIGETGDARQGPVAAVVKSYAGKDGSPVVSAIISNDGTDVAHIVLIQADGEGDTKTILTRNAIPDRKASAGRDLDFIVGGLKARKNWDALASFKWLASASNGATRQLFQLADRVEVATDAELALPVPQARVAEGQGQTVRTPTIPQDARGMDPSVLNNPPPPPQTARNNRQAPADDDSQFSDDPRGRYGRRGYPQQPRQYGDGSYPDQYGGYPPPPEEMQQPRGYPNQRGYPQQQQQPRNPRGYANNGGGGYGGYPPPPPPFGGGGPFGGFFNN